MCGVICRYLEYPKLPPAIIEMTACGREQFPDFQIR